MRTDPAGSQLTSRHREPRVVVGIIFPTASIYLTNRTGIANVPGVPIHGVLKELSATSQEIQPEEARATIGTLSFTAVDLLGALTDELRDQLLVELRGVRGREVRVHTGDTDDFTDVTWQRVETYVVDGCSLRGRSYAFTCSDRNREQRVDIFDRKKTRLTTTLTASATSVVVASTAGFNMVAHTAAFTDAPSSTVGYIRIAQTGEIIRYTGTSGGNTFTGCTRGVFNTIAQECVVDGTLGDDRKPEIEEFIYLEGPGPWLDYAIKTGNMLGTANVLPSTWHMGIDPANVSQTQYDAIGTDLYDPSSITGGMQLRFTHLEKTDGKRFSEEQLHLPMMTYGPIDANGVMGIRRLVPIVSQAAPVALITPNNVISIDEVRHSLNAVVNRIVINWNFDGEKYTRRDVFIHAGSIAKHGQGRVLEYSLRGLTVQNHTPATLKRITDTLFERLAAPPIEFTAKLSRSLNALETGDPAQFTLPHVRDFTAADTLARVFEIQRRRVNWLTGELHAQVFGSTERMALDAPPAGSAILSDSWYSSAGVALNTVLTMSGNNVTANGNLAGNADLRSGVYYHLGDLVINSSVTVTINQNVQLRVRGSVTINGAIDGAGRGLAGTASPDTVSSTVVAPPSSEHTAFFGSTRSSDAISSATFGIGAGVSVHLNVPGIAYNGRNTTVPRLALSVASGALVGIPSDLRGAPGVYGPPSFNGGTRVVVSKGGNGGAGGAGLMIVSRGTIAFGASGQINLSGANGTASPATGVLGGVTVYGGGGAGGSPGALYSVLDGNSITLPDLTDAFLADQGLTPIAGTPAELGNGSALTFPAQPASGVGLGIGGQDHWEAAHVVQYVPANVPVGDSQDEAVPAPTALAVLGDATGAFISWTPPAPGTFDTIEVWWSTTNDRTGAVKLAERPGSSIYHTTQTRQRRYFWIRARKNGRGVSAWHPTGSTNGVPALFGGTTYEVVEDFVYLNPTELHARWTQREAGIADGDIVSTAFSDIPNGVGMRFGNNSDNDEWWAALTAVLLPYDPNETYEIGVIWRHVSGSGTIYMGVEGYDDDGVTQVDRTGGSSYTVPHFVAANAFIGSGSWQASRGYMRGLGTTPVVPSNDPSAPSVARTGVAYIRPVLLLDYNNAAGVVDVARVWVRRLPTLGMPNLGPNSTEVLVASQPADGTEVLPTISYSGGGTLVDYSPITAIEWTNDTGGSIDVILRQSARVQLSASDSLIGRKLAMRWSLNGGSSWSYDGTNTDNVNITAADWQPKSTQRTVTVADGETIDVESIVVLVIPDPTSGDPADVQYRGLSLSIESKLR